MYNTQEYSYWYVANHATSWGPTLISVTEKNAARLARENWPFEWSWWTDYFCAELVPGNENSQIWCLSDHGKFHSWIESLQSPEDGVDGIADSAERYPNLIYFYADLDTSSV